MRHLPKKKKLFLSADNFLKYENKIWFPEIDCNELYCYDLNTDDIKMVCKIDTEVEYQHRLFSSLVVNNKKIYMIPFSAEMMYEVDILTKDVKSIEIKEPDSKQYSKYNKNAKFISGVKFNNCVYLIGTTYPAIVEYDCIAKTISYYDTWVEDLMRLAKNNRIAFFRKAIICGTKIYAPSCMGNCILEFDVKTKKHQFFIVGSEVCSYSSICQVGEWMWLAPQGEGPVVKWNVYTNQWKEYWNFPPKYIPSQFSFSDIVYYEDYIYCIPLNSNMIIRIEVQREIMEEYELEEFDSIGLTVCVLNNKMYLFSQTNNQFIVLKKDKRLKTKELLMPQQQKKYHLEKISFVDQAFTQNNQKMIYENFPAELIKYIQGILKDKSLDKKESLMITNGFEIYRKIH